MTKWPIVYREIALELYKFWQKNKKTADTALFGILTNDANFSRANNWLAKLSTKFETNRVDPIQLFCSFSSNSQKEKSRINNINHILRLLGSQKVFEDIDFEGCPVPFTIRMSSARVVAEQKEIWIVFQTIVKEGRQGLQQKYFDQARTWYGVDISAFTIFLFWIDPDSFIPLDKHTLGYLFATNIVNAQPDTLFQYNTLLDSIPQSNIQNIVSIAYQQRRDKIKSKSPLNNINEIADVQIVPETGKYIADFKLLGINVLQAIDPKLRKVLLPGWYICYHCYEFLNEDYIAYHSSLDIDLYSNDKFDINISAVVGPNGSGKSTFTELFYAAINNMAVAHHKFDEALTPVAGLHLDLYFKTDFLYRIAIREASIQLFEYAFENQIYQYPREIDFNSFDFGHFFYSIAVNYAHYSLNSTHIGKWIDQLFHKNDGYQTPIVINPYRKKGNIDINKEHTLLKNRLLANLLEPVLQVEVDDEPRANMRQITDRQGAEALTFDINSKKFGTYYIDDIGQINLYELSKGWETVIPEINKIFGISPQQSVFIPGRERNLLNLIHSYLLRKVVNIASRYKPYNIFFDPIKRELIDIPELIALIKKDPSHITFKFKQAVNFIKYHELILPLIDFAGEKSVISLEDLSIAIERIKIDHPDEKYKTLELLPPSFIDTDIVLNDGEFFHDLSSGEKQRIYTVSSVVYHLININSVTDIHQLVRYRFVNVIFDEVELYFHPEMQRAFIDYLLNYLSFIDLNITALNFMFITHSPFILSDIPKSNILFLNPSERVYEFTETLGANIHDLLAHSFFLQQGFMGEYIKKQVKALTDFLTSALPDTPEWNEAKARDLINAIGEPLIKDRLEILYQMKYPNDLDLQIEALELKLSDLKDAKNKR